jgi:hypothetical protein
MRDDLGDCPANDFDRDFRRSYDGLVIDFL